MGSALNVLPACASSLNPTGGYVWPVHFSVASVSRRFSSSGSFQFKSFVLGGIKAEAASSVQKWQEAVFFLVPGRCCPCLEAGWGVQRLESGQVCLFVITSVLYRSRRRRRFFNRLWLSGICQGCSLGCIFHASGSCLSRS